MFNPIGEVYGAGKTLFSGAADGPGKVGEAISGLGGMFGSGGFTKDQQAYQRDLQAERQRFGGGATLDEDRRRQLAWMDELLRRAMGQGPSVAELQLKQGLDQALKQQLAVAAGARGPNVGLAQRNASIAGAGLQAQANAQAAQLRAAEMQQAGQLLGQQQTAGRQQDLDYANALRQNILASLGLGIEQQKTDNQLTGALIGGGAALAAGLVSDERQKTDIAPAASEVQDLLDKLSPAKFRYKDTSIPGTAPGERVGIIAQDLERSKAGKALVSERPDGTKEIDTKQGFGVAMAALTALHQRLKRLEAHG